MRLWHMPLCMATLSGLVHSVHSQGAALLTLSENPVYSGDTVMITCNYGPYNLLVSATIDAFDGSEKKGSLSCKGASGSTNGTGIFSGQRFLQACGGSSNSSNHFSVPMVVSQLLELDYNCTVAVVQENYAIATLTSVKTSLIVDDLEIKPNPATFNESHNAIVKCESLRGTPTSVLQLTIRSPNGNEITGSGNGSTSLLLPLPLMDWHNANARCTVINRIYPNISTTSLISVNHINCISSRNGALEEAAHGRLNCSTYVSGHPIDSFSWSVSTEVSVRNSSLLNGPVFTVMHGMLGSVNCTVTNSVTHQRAIVLFTMKNTHPAVTANTSYRYVPLCFVTTLTAVEHLFTQVVDSTSSLSDQYWIVCTVFGSSFIVLGLAIGIAYKRRSLNHGYEIQMTDNDVYVSLRVQPTGFTQAQPKNSNLVFYRLLVADKGVMADLSTLALPTTVLMEYSSGSEALNEIIAKLNQEIALPTTPNFKSVAIFLPAIENAKHINEDNQTMQSTESTTVSDVQILESFTRLTMMCLDQQSASSGIDIFNYCGSDADSLAGMLTEALKVPVTVSYGYGFGESKDLKKLHASSAAKYFNFSRLAATPVTTYS